MEELNITIIGAGVVGLAVAEELSQSHDNIFVIERNLSFGQEISSRNSEVIHAGIYYPKDSLKAKSCVEGRRLLYEFCRSNNIPHKKTGKLIVAINDNEAGDLARLYRNGLDSGAGDLEMFSKGDIAKIEPNVKAEQAIYSPSTGILDTHGFMKKLSDVFTSRGGQIAYNTAVTAVDKAGGGFTVMTKNEKEGEFKFSTRILINCAGLDSDKIPVMAGLKNPEYRLKYCKGDYFRVHNGKAKFINRLVYPVPRKEGAGLGIHATLDLGGGLRLGPDDEYVERVNYDINPAKQKSFYESVKTFLPFIQLDDLAPDTSGIRPKLQGRSESFRDFIIKDESENGFPCFINLIGIESPGFTACLSIAKLVKNLAKDCCA